MEGVLYTHVVEGADFCVTTFWLVMKFFRKTEVDDFNVRCCWVDSGEDDVFKFEISVDYVVVVHVIDGPEKFLHDFSDVEFVVFLGVNKFFESPSRTVFHNEINVFVVHVGF